jgi:hypothetical protein
MALECPTKLFYTKKPNEFADNKLDDPFLKALADGGFQVGELAKCYYPGGVEIEGLDYDKTWAETQEYLKQDNIILYEAAFKFNNLFVRVDVLKKTGNKIELIEVKSKSFNAKTFTENIWQKRNPNKLDSTWMPYIYDIAFQTYVGKLSCPDYEFTSFLMCADKDKVASIDGLNQKFLIQRVSDFDTQIKITGDVSLLSLGDQLLTAIDITETIFKIHNDVEESTKYKDLGFVESVQFFSDHYANDIRIEPEVDNGCKKCEFRTNTTVYESKIKSGFNECWKLCHGLTDDELERPFAFDVWFSPKLKNPKVLMEDIEESDFIIKSNSKAGDGLSRSERQWLQIQKVKDEDSTEYKDQDGIDRLFKTFKYPLHFIDFETSMVAIPFSKGRRPYEQIAFQFSHHVMQDDGSYRHAGEWISTTPGEFPNFNFVRALKKELENDEGSIFRYSNHENTVLCQIRKQLQNSNETDRDELCSWIETITHKDSNDGEGEEWEGARDMIDLCEIVKSFYYHPKTKGSNSIKYVLPAVLSACGRMDDPYKGLPPVFNDYDRETLDLLMSNDELANGGAAMTAYALMQFSIMTDEEREKIRSALLRYCKLDTEAMVWIYQYLCLQNKKSIIKE